MGTRLENAGMFQAAHEVRTYDCTYPEDKSHEEMMANSQLMVASPLLYEALEAFDKLLLFDSPIDSSTAFVIEGSNKELLAAIELARNALRAARGEE